MWAGQDSGGSGLSFFLQEIPHHFHKVAHQSEQGDEDIDGAPVCGDGRAGHAVKTGAADHTGCVAIDQGKADTDPG